MTDLTGKIALVTGASRGIGRAAALALAEAGAAVVAASRQLAPCHELAREIEAGGGRALALGCDVADYRSVERTVAATLEQFGRLDILINNAGVIDPIAEIADSDPDDWDTCIRINLIGAYHAARAVIPAMKRQGEGIILNVGSGAAYHALLGWSAYSASKAALASLTQSLDAELEGTGIRVHGFRPGTVNTLMQEKIRASGLNEIAKMQPEDHAPVEDPARAMVWLCGEEAGGLAGKDIDMGAPELRDRAGLDRRAAKAGQSPWKNPC